MVIILISSNKSHTNGRQKSYFMSERMISDVKHKRRDDGRITVRRTNQSKRAPPSTTEIVPVTYGFVMR
jgi:hypothetical protein